MRTRRMGVWAGFLLVLILVVGCAAPATLTPQPALLTATVLIKTPGPLGTVSPSTGGPGPIGTTATRGTTPRMETPGAGPAGARQTTATPRAPRFTATP